MLPGNFEICSSIIKMLDISTRLKMPQQGFCLNSHNQNVKFLIKHMVDHEEIQVFKYTAKNGTTKN